jgi:hypothetical protein
MNSSFKLLVLAVAICLIDSSVLNTNLILENADEDKTPNSYSASNS